MSDDNAPRGLAFRQELQDFVLQSTEDLILEEMLNLFCVKKHFMNDNFRSLLSLVPHPPPPSTRTMLFMIRNRSVPVVFRNLSGMIVTVVNRDSFELSYKNAQDSKIHETIGKIANETIPPSQLIRVIMGVNEVVPGTHQFFTPLRIILTGE